MYCRVMQSNFHIFTQAFIHSLWKLEFFRCNLFIVKWTLRYSFWFFLCICLGKRLSKVWHIGMDGHLSQHTHVYIYIESHSFVTLFWAKVTTHLFSSLTSCSANQFWTTDLTMKILDTEPIIMMEKKNFSKWKQ